KIASGGARCVVEKEDNVVVGELDVSRRHLLAKKEFDSWINGVDQTIRLGDFHILRDRRVRAAAVDARGEDRKADSREAGSHLNSMSLHPCPPGLLTASTREK